jgi:rod shape determining protein RodA
MMRSPLIIALVVFVAVLLGWSTVLLASISDAMQTDELSVQLKWMAIASAVTAACAFVPFRLVLGKAYLFYAGAIALLVTVHFGGHEINGSSRWLRFGGFSVQPSEVMKLAFVLALARALRYRREIDTARSLLLPGLLLAPPMALILMQPNLSTATLFVPVTLAMFYAAGAERRHLLALIACGVIAAVVGASLLLAPYQKDRILSTVLRNRLAPAERQREGYQLEQALRSIASGGWAGAGHGEGVQNRMNRLAFRHNDFIFSVACEEWGLIGAAALMLAILGLLFCLFRIAMRTREPGGRLFVVGIATLLGVQSFVHIGVNVGLIPTTGVTLPFVSSGGSSLVTIGAMIGLAVAIARQHVPVLAGDSHLEQVERLRHMRA